MTGHAGTVPSSPAPAPTDARTSEPEPEPEPEPEAESAPPADGAPSSSSVFAASASEPTTITIEDIGRPTPALPAPDQTVPGAAAAQNHDRLRARHPARPH